jgi:pimeloyl-ACP methyl ester carboxylesterase
VLILRVCLALAAIYVVLVAFMWHFQERIAFPAPRGTVPDPQALGLAGERITTTLPDGTTLVGWYLAPHHAGRGPGLLWFYGNGENIGAIWPVLRDFRPPEAALLVLDYPGYGASAGRATEAGLRQAAEAAYAALAARPEVDPAQIVLYGRSLGTTVATWLAARRPVAGVVLESPFTNAREMSRQHFGLFPRFVLRLQLDNLAAVAQIRSPVLVFHGTADRLVPFAMGQRVTRAAGGPAELVAIEDASHNETYARGGAAYRDRVREFVRRVTAASESRSP